MAAACDGGPAPQANLPFSNGKSFRSLDEYLAHRERLGACDVPYYEEIGPGLYRLEGYHLPPPQEAPGRRPTFTREELEREFGFRQ
jgi:hypothetical protein